MNAFEATSTYLSPSLALGSLFNMQTSSWNQKEQIVYKIVYIQFAIQPPGQSPCHLNSSMQLRGAFDWRQVPMFRLLLFMVLGMGMQAYLPAKSLIQPLLIAGLLAATIPLLFWEKIAWRWQYRLWWLPASCIALLLISLGYGRAMQYQVQHQPSALEQLQNRWLLVRLDHAPSERPRHRRVFARIEATIHKQQIENVQAGLLLYLPRNQTDLQAGSRLWIWSEGLQQPPENRNPAGFSYRQYLQRKHIHYQLHLKNSALMQIAAPGYRWYHPAALQALAAQQLRRWMPQASSSAFATALLLGDRSALPGEIVQAYSSSGLIHVLAVSGLHVGIIYVLLQSIWGKLLGRQKTVQLAALLACLWLYAAVTGLSASVTRASLMCSLLAIGKHFHRQAGVYNTLSAAALLLLWVQPSWLFDTGFQLSFAAVTGIVYLQPMLVKSIYLPHPWLLKIWELSCVTLSAQLFTLPLTLHYFGQFPNYFLLTNLLVLPLMAPILGGCLLLLAVSPLPFLAKPLGWCMSWAIEWLNKLVLFFDTLPAAATTGIRLDVHTALLLFALIMAVSWWYAYRKPALKRVVLLLAFVLLSKSLWQQYRDRQQALLVIYDQYRQASGAMVIGKTAWYWGQELSTPFAPHQSHFTQLGIQKAHHQADSSTKIWCWPGGSLLHLRGKEAAAADLPEADWLLLSHQPSWRKLEPQLGKFKVLLLDSSNSPYYCKKLKQLAAKHQIPLRLVAEEGAVQIPLCRTNTSKFSFTTASDTLYSTGPKSAMLSTPNW